MQLTPAFALVEAVFRPLLAYMMKYADNVRKWLISRAGAVRMCYNWNASAVTENKEADGRRSTGSGSDFVT